jgi:hypothetical protein
MTNQSKNEIVVTEEMIEAGAAVLRAKLAESREEGIPYLVLTADYLARDVIHACISHYHQAITRDPIELVFF